MAAQRIKMTSKLLGCRYNDGGGVVITTPHEREKLQEIYGDGNARKAFDAAGIVRIGKAEARRTR